MSAPRRALLASLSMIALGMTGAAAGGPITITDHENRTVTLKDQARRIASIPIPMASTIISIDGGASRLVGMNPTAKSAIVEGILGKIFPESRNIPASITAPNFIPNIEELAATNPDLVVQWANYGTDYIDPITNAGLTVMLISYGTEQKAREYFTMIATAMDKPERAEAMIGWRAAVTAEMTARTKGIAAAAKPKVLYLSRALETLTASGSKGNYASYSIDLAGGVSASADVVGHGTTISPEQIAEWNPDVILLNSFEDRLKLSRIHDDPILSLTNAARNNKVYKMPLGGYRWDPPNQESPLTWMWLANLLHPDIFQYDLRAEMQKAYAALYGYALTAADIDGILRIASQGDSANYAQFKAQ